MRATTCGHFQCSGGLACFAGHIQNRLGEFLDFGFAVGDHLAVRSSTIAGARLGLFSRRLFEKGDVISTYDGYVSDKSFMPAMPHRLAGTTYTHLHSIPRCEFVVWGFRYAIQGRGVASFANHAFHPNSRVLCRAGVYPYTGFRSCPWLTSHLVLVASTTIHPDEEITMKYSKHTCARLGITFK